MSEKEKIDADLKLSGKLSIRVHRADGTVEDQVVVSEDQPKEIKKTKRLYDTLKREGKIPLWLGFGAFLSWLLGGHGAQLLAVVTTAGVNYMAADFLAASAARINAFKYHDSGTGVGAEGVGNIGLGSPTGDARVIGTGTNPSANVYRSAATLTYSAGTPLTITEWGLFSAAAGVTLWDRRVWGGTVVNNGDAIAYEYDLTINAGG